MNLVYNLVNQKNSAKQLGPNLKICQINVEGTSTAKSVHLSRILRENDIDVAAIQETHTDNETQFLKRGVAVDGYTLIGATYHAYYGTATYVKKCISDTNLETYVQ